MSHNAMSERLEQSILYIIENDFLSKGFFFTNQMLKNIALRVWALAGDEDKLRPMFNASDHWCQDFRVRHSYVWRKAHLARRPGHDSRYFNRVNHYIRAVKKLLTEHTNNNSLFLVANMDETCWKIAYPGELTWARSGAKEVKITTNYNTKEALTAIATITADPEHHKLPLYLIAKGTTPLCERQLGNHEQYQWFPLHSKSGWSKKDTMIQYLSSLRKYYDTTFTDKPGYHGMDELLKDADPATLDLSHVTHIDLIWDCYAAHRDATVKEAASRLGINLYYVPAGGTDEFQPLDIKVFGALKATARKVWNQRYINDSSVPQNKVAAVQILLGCWEDLEPASINAAWNSLKEQEIRALAEDNVEDDDILPRIIKIARKISFTEFPLDNGRFRERTNARELVTCSDSRSWAFEEENQDESDYEDETDSDFFMFRSSETESPHNESEIEDDGEEPTVIIHRNPRPISAPKLTVEKEEEISNTVYTPMEANLLLEVENLRKEQRNFLCHDQTGQYAAFPEVVGIVNMKANCYLNAALQVLYAIPNVEDVMKEPNIMTKNDKQSRNDKYNMFLQKMIEALHEMNDVVFEYQPIGLLEFSYFKKSNPFLQVISDFLKVTLPVGMMTGISSCRFENVDANSTVYDVLNQHTIDEIGSILFFLVKQDTSGDPKNPEIHFRYEFPFSVVYPQQVTQMINQRIFLLKAVVCHYPNHYTTYVRHAFSARFLEINDSFVRECGIDANRTHFAL
jgi:hypothetical protein